MPLLKILLVAIFFGLSSLYADTGSIEGVVPIKKAGAGAVPVEKYRGKISGKVAPPPAAIAGVWLEGATLAPPVSPPSVTLSQSNYRFEKPLLVIPTGATVAFPNNDPDYHNIYSLSRPKRFDLGRTRRANSLFLESYSTSPGSSRCAVRSTNT